MLPLCVGVILDTGRAMMGFFSFLFGFAPFLFLLFGSYSGQLQEALASQTAFLLYPSPDALALENLPPNTYDVFVAMSKG